MSYSWYTLYILILVLMSPVIAWIGYLAYWYARKFILWLYGNALIMYLKTKYRESESQKENQG